MDATTVRRTERAHYLMQLSVYFSELSDVPGVRFASTHRFADTWYNQAYDVVCADHETGDVVHTIRRYLEARNRLPCVYLTPAVQPASFADRLADHGFVEFEREAWMFANPAGNIAPATAAAELTVEQVSSDTTLAAFTRVYRNAFPGPEVEQYVRAVADGRRQGSPLVDTSLFLACCRGEPAGILSLYCLGRYAGIYDVATAEQFRRQGIARALLRHAALHARRQGCDCVFLQTVAGEAGERAFARAGYETCYIRRGFVPRNAAAALSHG